MLFYSNLCLFRKDKPLPTERLRLPRNIVELLARTQKYSNWQHHVRLKGNKDIFIAFL
jgi:hypothetical protein